MKDLTGSGELLDATWHTLYSFLMGLAAGMVIGTPIGMALGRYTTLDKLFSSLVRLFYSIPIIALFPLIILWFGPGLPLIMISVFLASLLPAVMSAQAGVASVDRSLIDVATVFGATEGEIFRKVIALATVPFIAAGFKIAIGRAIVTTIAVELLTSQTGLGGLMAFYGNQLETAQYFAPLVVVATSSLLVYLVGDLVERRLSRWRTAAG
jgi:NitT/TauT family transport system permease protein